MRRFELRAAATALGAVERPRGDRISIWCGEVAPKIFQELEVENRKPSWVVYVPPRLFASDIACSLRHRENNGVAVYRMSFGGVVYVGTGRCIDTARPGGDAISCRVVSPNFLNFSREWLLHLTRAARSAAGEFTHSVRNAVTEALKPDRRRRLARRFVSPVARLGQTLTASVWTSQKNIQRAVEPAQPRSTQVENGPSAA